MRRPVRQSSLFPTPFSRLKNAFDDPLNMTFDARVSKENVADASSVLRLMVEGETS